MTRHILITGVTGFSGRHLAAALASEPTTLVFGTGRRATCAAPLAGYRPCDILDGGIEQVVEWAKPEIVYHVAGCQADASPESLTAVNVGGFEQLRNALRRLAARQRVRMLVIGSAAEIGHVPPEALPVDESIICKPTTAYGQSKHALVQAALAEPPESGLEIVVARPFNLVGAGLGLGLAPGRFAAAVRAVADGQTTTIQCGWLGGKRDYLDIRDAVRAYQVLVALAAPGTLANVCSGRSVQTGDVLARLLAIAGATATIVAQEHPLDHDIADIRGSHALLTAMTGWQPAIDLHDSLAALYGGTAG